MRRRSNAEKMPSDVRTAACDYRWRQKSEKMRLYARSAVCRKVKGVKKF